jgi:hypothetical protein
VKDFSAIQTTIQKNKDTAYVNGLARSAMAANANRSMQVLDKGMMEPVKMV